MKNLLQDVKCIREELKKAGRPWSLRAGLIEYAKGLPDFREYRGPMRIEVISAIDYEYAEKLRKE